MFIEIIVESEDCVCVWFRNAYDGDEREALQMMGLIFRLSDLALPFLVHRCRWQVAPLYEQADVRLELWASNHSGFLELMLALLMWMQGVHYETWELDLRMKELVQLEPDELLALSVLESDEQGVYRQHLFERHAEATSGLCSRLNKAFPSECAAVGSRCPMRLEPVRISIVDDGSGVRVAVESPSNRGTAAVWRTLMSGIQEMRNGRKELTAERREEMDLPISADSALVASMSAWERCGLLETLFAALLLAAGVDCVTWQRQLREWAAKQLCVGELIVLIALDEDRAFYLSWLKQHDYALYTFYKMAYNSGEKTPVNDKEKSDGQ